MRKLALFATMLFAVSAYAQISVVGTYPPNGSTNVPLNTVFKVWFSGPLDTTQKITEFRGLFSSIDSLVGEWYSTNKDTAYFSARLRPSTAYFTIFYWVPGQGGATLALPYRYEITTASAFSGVNVSGTVTSSSGGVSPANAVVGLSTISPVGQNPIFVAGTIADGTGHFTIPHVPAGTLFPVAGIDENGDGNIDPQTGDAVAIGASIVVGGTDYSGVTLSLTNSSTMTLQAAIDSASAYASAHLAGYHLRFIQTYNADSTGASIDHWEFDYYKPAADSAVQMEIQTFGISTSTPDQGTRQALAAMRDIPNLSSAASPATFVANVEAAGGRTFRDQTAPPSAIFERTLSLGQLRLFNNIPNVPDTSQFYWGAQYHFDIQVTRDSSYAVSMSFYIGDFTTGNIVSVTGISHETGNVLPAAYALNQNYPNPFNPSTVIAYALPSDSRVTLDVFNLLGQKVATLVNGQQTAGTHHVSWAPSLASGVYFYRIDAVPGGDPGQHFIQVRKMILVR